MRLFCGIGFIFLVLLSACSTGDNSGAVKSELMGQFDSVVIAQKEGIDIDFFYKNKVHHIQFPSQDSLPIFADIYDNNKDNIRLLLCHQAGYSKGAYMKTGYFLSQLGFNAMAIDLRSGGSVNNVENQTAQKATELNLPTEYLNAKPDLIAAIDYLYDCNGNEPIILVGSSYSASLCLWVAKNNEKVKAVAAFSPGEYLPKITLKDSLIDFDKPLFVTSSKIEIEQVAQLTSSIDSNLVSQFKPTLEGIHGASALWQTSEGFKMYWSAFLTFLKKQS